MDALLDQLGAAVKDRDRYRKALEEIRVAAQTMEGPRLALSAHKIADDALMGSIETMDARTWGGDGAKRYGAAPTTEEET